MSARKYFDLGGVFISNEALTPDTGVNRAFHYIVLVDFSGPPSSNLKLIFRGKLRHDPIFVISYLFSNGRQFPATSQASILLDNTTMKQFSHESLFVFCGV